MTTIDLTNETKQSIKVRWSDGKHKPRNITLRFVSGFGHGLLCVEQTFGSTGMETLGYLSEKGQEFGQNKTTKEYAQ